jgi:hypothetical protein
MRIPVFARRSNPAIDRPFLKKSLFYTTEQVAAGRADWVDPAHPEKGIICRELLYFGERPQRVETIAISKIGFTTGEIPGLRWVGPKPKIQLVATPPSEFQQYAGAATA